MRFFSSSNLSARALAGVVGAGPVAAVCDVVPPFLYSYGRAPFVFIFPLGTTRGRDCPKSLAFMMRTDQGEPGLESGENSS